MAVPSFFSIRMTENRWRILIAAFSCICLVLTVFCLSRGITIVFMHLYYIPIVLLAYHYRGRGFFGILLLTLAYLLLTWVYTWGDWGELEVAVVRAFVFLGIGALVIYLSDQMIRNREALSQSLQIQKSIIQNANVWLMVIDSSGRILEWNTAAETISGYHTTEVIGKKEVWKWLYPEKDYRRDVHWHFSDIVEKEKFRENLKTIITCRDGSQKVILWNTKRLPREESVPERFIAIGIDVTETTQAEENLQKSEEQLALAIEGSGVGLWDWHVDTGKVEYNERWAEIGGYTLAELAPLSINTWIRLCHPDDLPRSQAKIKEHFAKLTPMYECEVRIRHKDGRWIWVLDRGKVVEWDLGGRPMRMTGTHLDITERKQTEDALRMANTKLNLLSGITRHDILNQLAALMGYLELSEDYEVDPTLQTYLDRMKTVSRVIQKQIEFTRVYQDIGSVDPTWQNIHAIIGRMVQSLDLGTIRVEEENTDVEILADPLLEKVFYNLFDNAIKYGEKITMIHCSGLRREDGITLVVEDDGVGVSSGDKKRLFQKGFGKHTGLGLFLSREILAITGISITENGEPGKGARFEITVPGGSFRSKGEH